MLFVVLVVVVFRNSSAKDISSNNFNQPFGTISMSLIE